MEEGGRKGGRTLYGAYHLAKRVLPLTDFVSLLQIEVIYYFYRTGGFV